VFPTRLEQIDAFKDILRNLSIADKIHFLSFTTGLSRISAGTLPHITISDAQRRIFDLSSHMYSHDGVATLSNKNSNGTLPNSRNE